MMSSRDERVRVMGKLLGLFWASAHSHGRVHPVHGGDVGVRDRLWCWARWFQHLTAQGVGADVRDSKIDDLPDKARGTRKVHDSVA